jgi:uncharacterized protein YndB with AHSA1/START domain
MTTAFNNKLDLTFERIVDVPPHLVWRAWTEPALIKHWFCPLPWKTIDAEVDLRPGGIFRTTMQSPEGKEYPNIGCYLETVKNERIVWTNAMLPGFRPAPPNVPCHDEEQTAFMFTAKVEIVPQGTNGTRYRAMEFEPHGANGTKYRATVIHADEAGAKKHATMGFEGGWSTALDQLVAMVKKGI